jgi:hypothetical protein
MFADVPVKITYVTPAGDKSWAVWKIYANGMASRHGIYRTYKKAVEVSRGIYTVPSTK